ncbi:ATP-dependent endonuclease [Bacteroidia bacterium]|nr:ATP-dependent endonuclease [Bacteroidia bacterium]
MLTDFLSNKITENFPFPPTEEQANLISELSAFLLSRESHEAFLLKGFAGTGKTTVISALVRTHVALQQNCVLLAPTGRAAKVFANYSGEKALTIHKKIYRQKPDGAFGLNFNQHKHTLFIVDEASMIGNTNEGSTFGSGFLLDDLIDYVYQGENCRLLLVGDTAQLPPVMQPFSPALERTKLESYGLNVREFLLINVLRQAQESGILFNATALRRQISDEKVNVFPKFKTKGFSDIKRLSGEDFVDAINTSYREVGIEETIVVTRSNKAANIYSFGIRNRVLYKEDQITNGDLLMITRNNYFWGEQYEGLDFIANGDMAEIVRVGRFYEMYGYQFADLTLRLLDYEMEIDARVLLDTLAADTPAAAAALNQTLFTRVQEDYMHIGNKRERYRAMRQDPYLCALQVKFAYAVTCHKAQGGQWAHVYIEQGQVTEEMLGIDYYRWLYTALTRAKEKVFLVNFPSI